MRASVDDSLKGVTSSPPLFKGKTVNDKLITETDFELNGVTLDPQNKFADDRRKEMFHNQAYKYKGPEKFVRERLTSSYLDTALSRNQIINAIAKSKEAPLMTPMDHYH